MKKIGRFISSMQFAIILLGVLAAYCVIASFVTQGQSLQWYAQVYSERTAGMIVALGLDDAFHSVFFIAVTSFLCLNLLLCNLLRAPALVKRWRALGKAEAVGASERSEEIAEIREVEQSGAEAGAAEGSEEITETGKAELSETTVGTADQKSESEVGVGVAEQREEAEYGKTEASIKAAETDNTTRMRFGMWGAWVTHLGVLLLILGFGLGQATKQEYTVYGVTGTTRDVGNTGCALVIDDFDVALREDDTVEQYTAQLTMYNLNTGESESGSASVNNPATLLGYKCYQNSTGWAADVHILKNDEPLQDSVIYAGEYVAVEDKPDLQIWLSAFYPDYVLDSVNGPMSASSSLNNPAYLYMVYYGDQLLGMNALMADEKLTIDEYTVTFDNPRNYTLIQVKEDHFQGLALIGGLLVLFGLVLAFYVKPHPEV